jgi:hypothetical protein
MSSQKKSVIGIDVIRYLMNYKNAKEFLKKLGIDDVVCEAIEEAENQLVA